MARNQKERNVRRDPGLREGTRDVQLQPARRFYTAAGNDTATREARALSGMFGAGVDLNKQIVERKDAEGSNQASFDSAAGKVRDAENTNRGYADMWDQIEAKNDLHLFSKELPELLRGADWENLSEQDAQGVIDGYFQDQLKGINPDSTYGRMVSEGIFAQNAQLIETHKNFQLERIRQEQRVMIYNEAAVSYEVDGVLDYESLAKHTGLAFDGPEKMVVWIESLAELAVRYEDETIIDNMPERFPSGDPTGKNDPKFAAEFNTARNKARAARERTEAREASAAKAAKEAMRQAATVDLYDLALDGIDPTATAIEFAQNGTIEVSDVGIVTNAFRTSRDDRAQHGFDPQRVAIINTQLAVDPSHSMVSPGSLYQDWARGVFGPPDSPEAKTAYRQVLQDVAQAQERRQRLASDPSKKVWVGRFNESFPVPKDQFGIPTPGILTELRAAYSAEFELAILNANSREEYAKAFEEFSKRYKEQEKLVSAQESSRTPKATLSNIVRNNFTAEQAAAHLRSQGYTIHDITEMRRAGEFGKDKEFVEGSPLHTAYRALLQELSTQ